MSEHEPTIHELFDLTGKVALITGASGYLGSSMGRALAEAGARVVAASREQSRADEAAAGLPQADAGHFGVTLDYLDDESIRAGFTAAVETAGQVDILINNGTQGTAHTLDSVTGDEFRRQLAIAGSYFQLARLLHDHVVGRQSPGSVVMIGSMYGVVGSYPPVYVGVSPPSPVAYHALKGGVIHLTRHLAVSWAPDGVRVNCLSPGPFPSSKAPAGLAERLCDKSPQGRMGHPHELKGALLLLASEAGSYITGQNLLVDGGWTAW